MPYAQNGRLRVYYESAGRGPAVLLILGQGMSLESGWRTIERLSPRFRVLAFDNRDVGRSDRSALPYAVAQMARDACAVLDAAGERRAHVYGLSLGGMVAQEFALRYRDRVRGARARRDHARRAVRGPDGPAGADLLHARGRDGRGGGRMGGRALQLRPADAP